MESYLDHHPGASFEQCANWISREHSMSEPALWRAYVIASGREVQP